MLTITIHPFPSWRCVLILGVDSQLARRNQKASAWIEITSQNFFCEREEFKRKALESEILQIHGWFDPKNIYLLGSETM